MLARGQITVTNLDDGIGVKGVTGYYLASPLSEGIRKDTPGWTTEMQPLTPENKYLWNKEIVHYTDNESALKDKTEVLSGAEIFTDKADADAVVHVEVDGKSYQHAGSGKNLFNFREWSDMIPSNAPLVRGSLIDKTESSITLKSILNDAYTNTYTANGLLIPVVPEKTYTFSYSTMDDVYGLVYIFFHSNNQNLHDTLVSNSHSVKGRHSVTFVTPATTTSIKVRLGIRYAEKTQTYYDIQLEEGSTATAYEPPAPTPDYPIEIHSLNDFDVVSSVGGRNLILDSDNLNINPRTGTSEKLPQYLDVTNVTKILNPVSAMHMAPAEITSEPLKEGQTYTLSALFTYSGVRGGSNQFYLSGQAGNYVNIQGDIEEGKFNRVFITVTARANPYMRIHMNFTGYEEIYLAKWKLEKGNKATDWTPAPEDITENSNHPLIDKINLLLSEPLRSVGDVKDRLFRDNDGLWKIERNVAEGYADGSEDWVYQSAYGRFDASTSFLPISGADTSASPQYNTRNSHYGFSGVANSKKGYFTWVVGRNPRIIHGDMTSVSELKAFIKSQYDNGTPVTWVYQVAKTIEILDQELQDKLNNLRSFQDSNYVYTVVDKTNILPNYVSENLKPNLHATFKSKAWSGNNAGYPSVIGVYGDSAKMLYLSTTAESMTFNADGTPNPSSQVITLTANLQNVSGNASFAATAYNGSTVVSNVVLSGVGNTRTFNQAQFPASANRVQVRATLGNLVDTVTIVKLSNGSNGQNAVVGLLTNESITLPANKDGLVSSFVGATGIFDVYDGIAKKTGSGVAYSLVSQSNITVAINATTGVYSVTAMPTGTTVLNGHAVLRAVYNGVTIEKQLNVSKSVTGATGATGSTGAPGASATSYWITASNNIIGKSQTGVINPTTITFKGFSKTGTANSVAYSGRFIVQTSTNGTTYTTRYTSSADQNTYTYTIPSDSLFVKCLFYMAGGTTVLLDEQTVPIVESAEGIEVGGRNLLANSGKTITNGLYNIATYDFTVPPSQGDLMTVTIKGELASTKSHFGVFNSGGNVSLGSLKSVGGGLYTLTFNWNIGTSTNTSLSVYAFTNSQVGVSTIEWIKLEKGTVATDWTPAPEDVQESIEDLKSWSESEIKQTNDSITSSVSGLKTDIEGQISTAKSEIKQTTDSITQRVGKAEGLYTGSGSLFEQTSDGFKFSVKSSEKISDQIKDETKTMSEKIDLSVKSTNVEYYLSNSTTVLSGGVWQTTAPAWVNEKYIWQRTKVVLSNGSTKYTPSEGGTCVSGAIGPSGSEGKGVASITSEYALSDSKIVAPTDETWTTTAPPWVKGVYIWTRSKIVYSNPVSISYTTPIADSSWEAVNELEKSTQEKLDAKVESDNIPQIFKTYETTFENNAKNQATEVLEKYIEESGIEEDIKNISSKVNQIPEGFEWTTTQEEVKKIAGIISESNIQKQFMSWKNGKLSLGNNWETDGIEIDNKTINFMQGGHVVAWVSGGSFHMNNGVITKSVQVGSHQMVDYGGGLTVFDYIL